MKKYYNNVWTWPYSNKYYLTHPHKWFSQLGRNIRAAHMRATCGWCYSDVWDWDSWFMHTVPDMFRHMADHGCGYPGFEPFETPEKWHDWLHKMADQIESCTEEAQEKNNEYYEEFINQIMDKWKFEKKISCAHTELDDKYYARAKELGEKAHNDIKDALNQIGDNFERLWD